MKRAKVNKQHKPPLTNSVVKRARSSWSVEYFCVRCQREVDNPNQRCKGSKR